MRKTLFVSDEYYHIYNRGTEKRNIFIDDTDYTRFLFLLLIFQAPIFVPNVHRHIKKFVQHRVLNKELVQKILRERIVELVTFAQMPNHFHTTIRQLKDKGISIYMQRVLDAYVKYFNTKYERSGHLFQGPFQAIHVAANEQLLYLSAYIHKNPSELNGWEGKKHFYPWSSYQDFVIKNRWGELLCIDRILEQFKSPEEYKEFVDTSGAKEKDILTDLL